MDERLSRVETKVDALEIRVGSLGQSMAVAQAQQAHIDKRFDKIDSEVGAIRSDLKRVAWIIVTAVLGAVVTFALRGGFFLGS